MSEKEKHDLEGAIITLFAQEIINEDEKERFIRRVEEAYDDWNIE